MASEEGGLRAQRMQVTLPHLSSKDAKRRNADNSLSHLLDTQGLGQNIARGGFIRATKKALWLLDPVTKYPAAALRALLIINEATDSMARFKLSTKYKGVAMWGGEKDEWRRGWSRLVQVESPLVSPKATRNDCFNV
jgi:hypothetical protein